MRDPKAQGSDPLVHQVELQHMAAELGLYEQSHTSPPPFTMGNSRVVEGRASLKECVEVIPTISSRYLSTSRTRSGSFPTSEVMSHVPKASLRVQRSGRRGPLLRLPPDPLCTGPLRSLLQVVSPRHSFRLSPAGPHGGRPGHPGPGSREGPRLRHAGRHLGPCCNFLHNGFMNRS